MFGIEFLDLQKYVFMNMWTTPFVLLCQCRNSGKALSLNTKIPTPNGIKTMGELKVGDYVFGDDGQATKILFESDTFYNHKCYEIKFEDGEKIICDENHLWTVKIRNKIKVMSTMNMSNDYVHIRKDKKGKEYKYRVPMTKPLDYEEKNLPIHPYALGVWLGDGNSHDVRVTSCIDDYEEMSTNIKNCGYKITITDDNGNNKRIGIGSGEKGTSNIFSKNLRELDLFKNKHIPNIYLYGSIEQRYELLKGLMDTDGFCSKDVGECEFSQKDYGFILQFSQLLSSLGIKHSIDERYTSCNGKYFKSYRVRFFVDKDHSCFKFKRKHDRLRDKLNKRMLYKSIISIKEVESVPTKCIGVDNESHLYLCGDRYTATHNSTISAPYLMAKAMLYPNFYSYIISTNGSQAQETFLKIEKICKRQLSSFTGLTDVFQNEIITSNANKDGFTHKPESFTFGVFNGSKIHTLNSNYDGSRGKRSNCNFYDETGFMLEKAFSATEPFTTQDANFKLGGDIDVSLEPQTFPNQLIYASSASSIDTYFFTKYKEFSKQMLLGNKNYFVADINCDLVLNPMFNGKLYPVSLLTQEKIDNAMRENKEQALREYHNIFSKEGGEQQPFKRGQMIKNSEVRRPMLINEGNINRYICAFYDPARSFDNSVVLFAEFFEDKELGWLCKIINCVSLVDIGKVKKTPMRTPEQIEYIRNILLDYNGQGFGEYENIGDILVDSGAGGAGVNIADYFMEDWTDKKGAKRKGLIDKVESKDYINQFPDAVDKLKLISPKKYRTEMFDALVEMIDMDLISFTETYDLKGYLMLPYETELDVIDPETKKKQKEIEYKKTILTFEEELALKNIDLLKEELVQVYRFDNAEKTSHKYALSPDKVNTMHDDRAYVGAMCGWYLKQLRRKNITDRKEEEVDWANAPKFVSSLIWK